MKGYGHESTSVFSTGRGKSLDQEERGPYFLELEIILLFFDPGDYYQILYVLPPRRRYKKNTTSRDLKNGSTKILKLCMQLGIQLGMSDLW